MESKNNWKAWLYLAPTIILLSVFTFYPIINTFVVSFTADYDYVLGSKGGFTFQNYIEVLSPNGIFFDDVIKTALPNTLLLTFVTVPVSIILSLAIATSLDALAVGFSFGIIGPEIAFSSTLIGIVAFAATEIGVHLGKRAGKKISYKWTEIAGGCVLIAIGTKILVEHLHR